MTVLKDKYRSEIIAQMMSSDFGFTSVMQVPVIEKIVLNMGVGESINDKKVIQHAVGDMTKIAGQKPIVTKARKSVAGFKIREGWPIGCKVTLRGDRMYEFLERLITVTIPRIRDFRGLDAKFDQDFNYNFGIKEQIVFPEIEFDKVDAIRGLNITVVIKSGSAKESYTLLKAFGFPLKALKEKQKVKG